MDPIREQLEIMTRRHFFGRTGLGLGTAALSTLLADGDFRLVEAGPGQALATVARRHPAVTRGGSSVYAASPPRALGASADVAALRKLAGALA